MSVNLQVFIERSGKSVYVGSLHGTSGEDTEFTYAPDYLSRPDARAISISLPLKTEAFSPEQTRCFFDGLLPEGYTRRCVAAEIRVTSDDYISILKNLGKECLGAIQIRSSEEPVDPVEYEQMSGQQLRMFAREGAMESAVLVAKSHLSLTGASGKAGLYYDKRDASWYLPIGCAPSTHIVKQSHIRLSKIVANEQLCLLTARKVGISVPESFIVKFDQEAEEHVLFATRRYDRVLEEESEDPSQLPIPYRLHQEDFSQALGIPSEKKYEKNDERYLQKMMNLLDHNSANPLKDKMDLWRIVVFNYLIGNTDNHIKNSSLLYSPGLDRIRLAPAYDIVSTLIYESSSDELALGIHGKYNIFDITREDFLSEAKQDGLGAAVFMKEFDRLQNELPGALLSAKEELMDTGFGEMENVYSAILQQFQKRFEGGTKE